MASSPVFVFRSNNLLHAFCCFMKWTQNISGHRWTRRRYLDCRSAKNIKSIVQIKWNKFQIIIHFPSEWLSLGLPNETRSRKGDLKAATEERDPFNLQPRSPDPLATTWSVEIINTRFVHAMPCRASQPSWDLWADGGDSDEDAHFTLFFRGMCLTP